MLNCMMQPCSAGRYRLNETGFFPYLHGSGGEGQPGWHVYMRDGHHGIIYVKLHDPAL